MAPSPPCAFSQQPSGHWNIKGKMLYCVLVALLLFGRHENSPSLSYTNEFRCTGHHGSEKNLKIEQGSVVGIWHACKLFFDSVLLSKL